MTFRMRYPDGKQELVHGPVPPIGAAFTGLPWKVSEVQYTLGYKQVFDANTGAELSWTRECLVTVYLA